MRCPLEAVHLASFGLSTAVNLGIRHPIPVLEPVSRPGADGWFVSCRTDPFEHQRQARAWHCVAHVESARLGESSLDVARTRVYLGSSHTRRTHGRGAERGLPYRPVRHIASDSLISLCALYRTLAPRILRCPSHGMRPHEGAAIRCYMWRPYVDICGPAGRISRRLSLLG